jgi:hypothetical protein
MNYRAKKLAAFIAQGDTKTSGEKRKNRNLTGKRER